MAWGAAFAALLESPCADLVFVARSFKLYNHPTGTRFTGMATQSTGRTDLPAAPRVVDIQAEGDDLNPASWSQTLGAWSVLVAGTYEDLGTPGRGDLLRVYAGAAHWSQDEFEPILLGIIESVEQLGDASVWRVSCWGALSILQSRYTTTGEDLALMGKQSTTTVASGGWTPASTTLAVASSDDFEKLTGASGLLYCEPSSGSPFYLLWSAKSTGQFTVTTTAVLGTTAVSLSSGDLVSEVAYFPKHPIEAALIALLSTGDGVNGDYDVAPLTWGYGLPESIVDVDDAAYFQAQRSPSAGATLWSIAANEAQDNGLSWWQGVLSPGGFFFGFRQGRLTVRGVLVPELAHSPDRWVITDRDIVSIDRIVAYDGRGSVAYKRLRAVGPTTSDSYTGDVSALPAERTSEITLQHAWTNEGAWLAEVVAALGPWRVRTPVRVELTLCGLRFAAACIGDQVELRADLVNGRLVSDGDAVGMLLQVSPAWNAGVVRVAVELMPGPDTR